MTSFEFSSTPSTHTHTSSDGGNVVMQGERVTFEGSDGIPIHDALKLAFEYRRWKRVRKG